MKFIIIVAVVTSIYVCTMDVVNKFTSSLNFSKSSNSVVEVSISGEVNNTGTYYLPSGASLKDLVMYAGGFTDYADVTNLIASEILADGKSYYVPTKKEDVSQTSSNAIISKVSINTASISQLENIPWIGSALAARIVTYRIENGKFTSLEELCNVKGIKEATLEKIRDYLTL